MLELESKMPKIIKGNVRELIEWRAREDKVWIVKRYVVEHYEVEASNREEAIEECLKEGDPYTVEVKKITVKKSGG